jgi:uncharacterized protein
VKITFDPRKNERNIRERGLSFERAAEFDFGTAITVEDKRRDYGEVRYRVLGRIGAELHALVFTLREGTLRVISLRRANRKERRLYAEKTGSGTNRR